MLNDENVGGGGGGADITLLMKLNLLETHTVHQCKIIEQLKEENAALNARLKKYTNGENHKRYYEQHKEKIKETGAEYLKKLKETNPEKIKEYSKRAYQKKKMTKV